LQTHFTLLIEILCEEGKEYGLYRQDGATVYTENRVK